MRRTHILGLMLSSCCVLAAPARAQDTPSPAAQNPVPQDNSTPAAASAGAAASDNAAGIGDIVVTAQRREERLQDVPIAITAFSQEALTRADVRDVTRLEQFTPGLSFGQSGFDFKPAIRGAATTDVDTNSATPIGFYVDDVFQTLAVEASQPFVDVARVEVDRGPQGTLFGRNTSGGAIVVTNNLPGREVEAGANLTYGNYDRKQVNAFISLPLGDSFGIRIAGQYEDRDPYVFNSAVRGNDLFNRRSRYIRGTAHWTPSDRLEVTLRGTYWREGGTGALAYGYKNGGLLVNPLTGQGDLNGTPFFFYTKDVLDGVPDIPGSATCTGACRDIGVLSDGNPYRWQGQFRPSSKLDLYSVSGQIRYSDDNIFIRSITSYQKFNYSSNTGTSIGPTQTTFSQRRDTNTVTQEFQLGGIQTKPFQWLIGLYYYRDRDEEEFQIFDPGFFCCGATLNPTDSYAAYAQGSYYVTDRVRLTAGGRYTIDKRRQNAQSVFYLLPVTDPSTTAPTSAGVQSRDFKRFTFRLGADFFATPANMLYGSVSTGFRSGGFNSANLQNSAVPPTFAPESVTAYEIGSKNRFADDRIQLNIAAFYNRFRSLQVPTTFPLPPPSVSVVSASLNAGAARAYGVEAEAIVKPVPELTLNATASLIDGKYQDYRFFGAPSRFYPTTNQNLSGNEIPNTPGHKFTLGAEYAIRVAGLGTFTPQVNTIISSHFYNTAYNSVLDRQNAYATVDATLGWVSEDERFGLTAFVTNIGEKAVLNSAEFGSTTIITSYQQPRFYGLRLSLRTK